MPDSVRMLTVTAFLIRSRVIAVVRRRNLVGRQRRKVRRQEVAGRAVGSRGPASGNSRRDGCSGPWWTVSVCGSGVGQAFWKSAAAIITPQAVARPEAVGGGQQRHADLVDLARHERFGLLVRAAVRQVQARPW